MHEPALFQPRDQLAGSPPSASGLPVHHAISTTSDAYIYTAGSGNVHGGARDGSSNPPLEHTPFVQPESQFLPHSSGGEVRPSGYPLRMDAQQAQYHLHDGVRAARTAPIAFSEATGIGRTACDGAAPCPAVDDPAAGPLGGLRIVKWHERQTLLAGQCKGKCDADETCKAFQENRYGYLHDAIKCVTFHFPGWLAEYRRRGPPYFSDAAFLDGTQWVRACAPATSPLWLTCGARLGARAHPHSYSLCPQCIPWVRRRDCPPTICPHRTFTRSTRKRRHRHGCMCRRRPRTRPPPVADGSREYID